MKIFTDPMPHNPTSEFFLEEKCMENSENAPDVDQLKGKFKFFNDDLSDPKLHNNDAGSLPAEMNGFIIIEPAGDGCADVIEVQIEAASDYGRVEPFRVCPVKIRADAANDAQSSADLSSMELRDPASHERYGETDGSSMKDISIDDGVRAKDIILLKDTAQENDKCIAEDCDPEKVSAVGSANDKVDVEWPVLVGLKSATGENSSEVLIQHSESEREAKDVGEVSSADTNTELSLSRISMESGLKDRPDTPHYQKSSPEAAADESICSSSTPESCITEIVDVSRVEQITPDPASHGTNGSLNLCHNQVRETSQVPEQQNTASGHAQRDHFESTFASVGPHTGSVAYSGGNAYSGSFSHRSDASTASTRSFAFPVLQNEWNFSPVRMRKADRRLLRRHRGWMHGFFCCKF